MHFRERIPIYVVRQLLIAVGDGWQAIVTSVNKYCMRRERPAVRGGVART